MKMLKKLGAFTLSAAMAFSMVANASFAKAGEVKTVKIFQFKVEIADALNGLVKQYEKSHPGVKIKVETVGGGADYGAALKARFASGDEPDIFNNGGFSDLALWQDKLEDLSDQPWVKNLVSGTAAGMTKNGKIYGQPMNVEGYGFIYNKELFAKAGIKTLPKTLPQLEAACKKLKAKGITAFSNGYQEFWILGIHNFNVVLAGQKDPAAFVNGLKNNTIKLSSNKIANDWVNLLDLTVKYGNKNPLTTDYNTQVTNFASGKTAMMQQGNWTQVQIDKINPKLKLGVLPMPISSEVQNKVYLGVPNNWCVNKKSKVKKEAKDFLNYIVSSKEGKSVYVNKFKFIPAFKNIPYTEKQIGSIGSSISDYANAGNTLTWNWFRLPDGAVNEIGADMQAYIAKKYNKKGLLDAIQKTVVTFANKTKK